MEEIKEADAVCQDSGISDLQQDGDSSNVRDLCLATSFDGFCCALKEVPDEIQKCVILERLLLHGNHISFLPGWLFTIISLTEVDLSKNKLSSIPEEIGLLENLTKFNVSHNRLSRLPKHLSHIPVERLNIGSNMIEYELETIWSLPGLVQLCASYTLLSTIPSNISDLVHMEVLEARGNSIQSISGEIENLVELRTLDLGHNLLDAVPYELETLPHLEEVYLDYNKLQSLPLMFGKQSRLRIADVSHNWFRKCPKGIDLTPELMCLDLSYNYLTIVPRTWCAMPKLTTLLLDNNPLVSVPVSLWECPMLEELSICNTSIDRVPSEIGGLQRLTSLFLSNCKLATLPCQIGCCTELRILNLRNNKLLYIPSTIGNLKNLRILDLCENRLTYLPGTLQQRHCIALWLHPNQRKALPDLQKRHVNDRDILVCKYLPQVEGMAITVFEEKASLGGPATPTAGQQRTVVDQSKISSRFTIANIMGRDAIQPAYKSAQHPDKVSTPNDEPVSLSQKTQRVVPTPAAYSNFATSSALPDLQTGAHQSAMGFSELQRAGTVRAASAEPLVMTGSGAAEIGHGPSLTSNDETHASIADEVKVDSEDQVSARKTLKVSFKF